MKKAFTLSEALITLAILGVLAAILVPVINNVRPDKDRITYKKALYSMQGAISSALDSDLLLNGGGVVNEWGNDPDGTDNGPMANLEPDVFCRAVADALNTAGRVDCNGPSSYDNPNFITTDGIRYWGLEGTITDDKIIFVDRNISSGELRTLADKRLRSGKVGEGLKIRVRADGKVDIPESNVTDPKTGTDFEFENELIENSLQVSAGKKQ